MTLSLMPFVVEIGIFGSLDFFFPFPSLSLSRRPRETLLSRSMSLSRSSERAEMRKKRAWMDAWCDARGAKQRVYVSPVTDRVNVGKDEEGLRFRGWTEGDGALPSPPLPGWKGRRGSESEMGGKKKGEKFPRPPRVRPCVTVCVARIFMRYITYSGK